MLSTIFSGMDDLIVIVVALVVIFGGSQLPKLARNSGEALREFRKAHSDTDAGASPAVSPPAATPVAPALPASAQVSPVAPGSEQVTLTRAELDALLAARAAEAKAEGSTTTGS